MGGELPLGWPYEHGRFSEFLEKIEKMTGKYDMYF